MRPATLLNTMPFLFAQNIVPMIEGEPGQGKTAITVQAATADGRAVVMCHAPLMQPEDSGLPVVNAARDGVHFVIPSMFPMEGTDTPDVGHIVVDELSQADNSAQKVWANIFLERTLHGQKLKPGWSMSATGNMAKDRAGANRLLSHLADRVVRIVLEPSLDDSCHYALENGVDPVIVAFWRFKPNMLSAFDAHQDKSPTPRGWVDKVSKIIGNVPAEAEFECIKGSVGEGAAAEFCGFLKMYRKLPNIDALLMDPAKAQVFSEPDICYAIAGAIAHRATPDNFERVMTYAKRMPPEFAVLTIRDAVRKDKSVQNTRAFIDWAMKEGQEVIM